MNVQRAAGATSVDAEALRRSAYEMIELASRIDRAVTDQTPHKVEGRRRPAPLDDRKLVLAARVAYRSRRERDQYLDADLFGEPAWDILLDLFIAQIEGRPMGVQATCFGAGVPPTTALRYVKTLEEERRLIEREAHPTDRRVFFLRLTGKGLCAMREYLRANYSLVLRLERSSVGLWPPDDERILAG